MEKFIKETIKEAGKIMLEGFESELEIREKSGFGDLVTQYDDKIEDFIIDKIHSEFPSAGILAEERGDVKKADEFLIIDPIDGTDNFTRNIPLSCIIIAYVEDNVVQYGSVYDPYRDELFYAQRGKGATLNDITIRVSMKSKADRLFGHTLVGDLYFPGLVEKYAKIVSKGVDEFIFRKLTLGSAGLYNCYTAAGRMDFNIEVGPAPWDMAGPSLILEEAGAKVTDIDDKPYKWDSKSIAAANHKLHEQIMKAMHG